MSMTKIQEIRVGAGGAATIDFASIPQIYSDLYLVFSARESSSAEIRASVLTVNGADVTGRRLIGESNSVFSQAIFIGYVPGANSTANTFSNEAYYIPSYTSAIAHSVSLDSVMENNSANSGLGILAGITTSTAAVTSLSVRSNVGNLVAGSSATLYGINRRQALGRSPQALGGNITYANGYWIHTFNGSGDFVPFNNIEIDYLVVAGGGGAGGGWCSGGGGAGGYRQFSGQSLNASTNYPVVVGAGGPGTSSFPGPATVGSNSIFLSNTSTGGGSSYTDNPTNQSLSGGSGAGGSYNALGGAGNTPSTSPSQGNSGGSGSGWDGGNNTISGGGGGGASGVGANGVFSNGGVGGSGSPWLNGSFYAGGGGGGAAGGAGGAGGVGGGGRGGVGDGSVGMTSGTPNTGGGGGGYGRLSGIGGSGGSGIVIVRYRA